MPSVPVVVICRDRYEPLVKLLDWLQQAGHDRVWLIDNDSAYPPLLDLYDRLPGGVRVVRLRENVGIMAPWSTGFLAETFPAEPYIVTDPDVVPDESCPLDVADHLLDVLDRFPQVRKVGLGLRLDDLPATYADAGQVRAFESVYWQREVAPGLFDAPVDTTFALYRGGDHTFTHGPALRTGPPYVARHLGWYVDSAHPTGEELFYRQRARPEWATWSGAERPRWLRDAIYLRSGGSGVRAGLYRGRQRVDRMAVRARSFVRWHVLRRRG